MNNIFNLPAPPDPVQDPIPYQHPIVTILTFIAVMAIFIGALFLIGSYVSSKIVLKEKKLQSKKDETKEL